MFVKSEILIKGIYYKIIIKISMKVISLFFFFTSLDLRVIQII